MDQNTKFSVQTPKPPDTDPEGPPITDPQPTPKDPYPVTDPIHDPKDPEPFPTPPEPIPELPPDVTYKMWSEIKAGLEDQRPTGKLTSHRSGRAEAITPPEPIPEPPPDVTHRL